MGTSRYRHVSLGPDRLDDVFDIDNATFLVSRDPEVERTMPDYLPWERTVGVEDDDGRLVAFHASYPLTLPLPGGALPAAGLTWVGVRPDHRRRGLLSGMIAAHFEQSLSRGEAISALFAAEPAIYGRYGYGSAADDVRLTLPRRAPLHPVAGSAELDVRFEPFRAERDLPVLTALEDAEDAASPRPGRARRTSDLVQARSVFDPPAWRKGAEALQFLTVSEHGRVCGAALVRRTEAWVDGVAKGEVDVVRIAAIGAAATHRAWEFLLDLDLTTVVRASLLPVDDPLLALLVDPRSARPLVLDNLWVRVLDVPRALAGRRYAAPVDVVLEVSDARLPANAGRWRVATTGSSAPGVHEARVERADDAAADLVLDVRELGATILGGRPLSALGAAGLVEERRPGALHETAIAFGWPVAPCSTWSF